MNKRGNQQEGFKGPKDMTQSKTMASEPIVSDLDMKGELRTGNRRAKTLKAKV